MTIDEMQKLRDTLETRLRNVAAEVVGEFQGQTNLAVTSVSIDIVHAQRIGDRQSKAIVSGARLNIEL